MTLTKSSLFWKETFSYFVEITDGDVHQQRSSVCTENGKNSAIRNCWISVIGAIKLHPFGTYTKWSEAHSCWRSAILLPLKHLSSNCIISTLFHCLTIEQFLIQVPSEVRHTCSRDASKIAP